MTRINTVDVKELTDQHLLAEYREITRLPKNLEISLNRKNKPLTMEEIPKNYTFGKGHVKFFYNKFKWLEKRFNLLVKECEERGFNISYRDSSIFKKVPSNFYNDWKQSSCDIALCKKRLYNKIESKPNFYRYKGILLNEQVQ